MQQALWGREELSPEGRAPENYQAPRHNSQSLIHATFRKETSKQLRKTTIHCYPPVTAMAACALRTAQQEQLLRHRPGTRGGEPGVLGGAAGLCWLYENGTVPPAAHPHQEAWRQRRCPPEDVKAKAGTASRGPALEAELGGGGEAGADGCTVLLCLCSWLQHAAKPPPRGKAGDFHVGYSFLICLASSRGFKRSSVHLRQHLGRPHPIRGGGKTNSAKI